MTVEQAVIFWLVTTGTGFLLIGLGVVIGALRGGKCT